MKIEGKLFILVTVLYVAFSCTPSIDTEMEQSKVVDAVHTLYTSFEEKNMTLMSEVMAHDDNMRCFGTDISEVHRSWSQWKQSHMAQFSSFDKAEIKSKDLEVYLSKAGNVAWFSDITDWTLIIQSEPIQMSDIRITGVLEKRDTVWRIVQIHASVPQRSN
ncbi:nuclear transport factor 2 family protein [Imtechella halotolerans]|uniref:SnoaL-like domain-containing protein n=1 Tax=Imtechella halotolerans K1 TaxID=946077 RepID=I0WBW4_9FLAO|nr:nuclear transport factor 2 family protein [Imtechella halotolerans]EID73880.1 hypothetical protein W5A_09955 [Imtechella halotolerans K1]WMQ64090.1 nuclear transport factor 2 family protein [Imtechella halotolerans]